MLLTAILALIAPGSRAQCSRPGRSGCQPPADPARISLTRAARQPTLTTDDVEQLLAAQQTQVAPQGLVIVERTEYQVEDPGGFVRSILQDFFSSAQPQFVTSYYTDDQPSQHDFGCPCGQDVDAFCEGDVDDAYASIFEKRLCLGDHADEVSEGCAMHLASAPTVVEYCRGEILETCRNLQPGENRIHECLLARPTVSDACAAYLATVAPPAPRLGFLFDVVDALFSAPLWAEQDDAPFDEVLEVPFTYDQVHGQQPYDDMEAMPPPRFSRVEGHPSPRFEGVDVASASAGEPCVDEPGATLPGGWDCARIAAYMAGSPDIHSCRWAGPGRTWLWAGPVMVTPRLAEEAAAKCPLSCNECVPDDVESLPLRGAGFGRGPLLNAGLLLDAEPPREVVVEVVEEESVEEQEADAVSSLLLLVSAAALCLASLSLAGLALGAARRRAREREELLAFKANYAPMLAESA